MIELSKNYVALNMAKFIYEEEVKAGKTQQPEGIKDYIFNLYEECIVVVEENDDSDYGLDYYDLDENEAQPE